MVWLIKRISIVLILGIVLALLACAPAEPVRTIRADSVTSSNTQPPLPTIDRKADRLPGQAKQIDDNCEKLGEWCAGVGFVEYDEFGRLFNPKQQEKVLKKGEEILAGGGLVLVYVHGWHHNASSENVEKFARAVTRAAIIDGKYAELGNQRRRRVFGVYVAWPGESIDSNHWSTSWLSHLTFWERKNVAHSVGNGSVLELLTKLAEYRKQREDSRLVFMGHSMGAAVLYSSISNSLLASIIKADTIGSFGDMVLLVNPAFEAMRVNKLWDLVRREYPTLRSQQENAANNPRLMPAVTIITSEADEATKLYFPLGRWFSTFFDSYADEISEDMNNTAVGHYTPFLTHSLSVDKADGSCERWSGSESDQRIFTLISEFKEHLEFSDSDSEPNKSVCFNDEFARFTENNRELGPEPQPVMLTRCYGIECLKEGPQSEAGRSSAFGPTTVGSSLPFINIVARKNVINDHNDVWNATLQAFVTQYVSVALELSNLPVKKAK